MSTLTRPLSEAQIRARRRNAQKSTGPRTSEGKRRAALNSVRHGRYSQPLVKSLEALGEDPRGFQRLLGDLIRAHQPANSAQRLLVEDLAALRWQRWRCERAQLGKLVHRLEELEFERLRRSREIESETSSLPQAEVLEKGVRNLPDSAAKFRRLLSDLDAVMEEVDGRRFSADVQVVLEGIYGKQPSLRGAGIVHLHARFLKGESSDPELEENLYKELRLALLEEARDAVEEYQLYLRQHVEISFAERSSLLAPGQEEWRLLIRQQNALDRQIERKTRLLMQLQREGMPSEANKRRKWEEKR